MSGGGPGSGNPLGVVAVIWSPVRTLDEVARGRRALAGFIVVAISACLGLISSTAFVLSGAVRQQMEQGFGRQPTLPSGFLETFVRSFEIGIPVLSLLFPLVGWILVSLLMQLATRLFGGTGPLSSMLGVVGVAHVPGLVGTPVTLSLTMLQAFLGAGNTVGVLLGYLGSLISLALFVWYVVLVVVGAALARNVGYGESAGSCALSCVGSGVLIILVVVVASIGIFTVVGAAAPQ